MAVWCLFQCIDELYWNVQTLKYKLLSLYLLYCISKRGKVWSCPFFRIVGTIAVAIAKAWPFEKIEIRPPKSLDFKCFRISNGQLSDPQCIQILFHFNFSGPNSSWTKKLFFGLNFPISLSLNQSFIPCLYQKLCPSNVKSQTMAMFNPFSGLLKYY